MISIEKCRVILNKQYNKYSIEEIKLIREYLYKMANIEYHLAKSI
jgi:hypothetical protein